MRVLYVHQHFTTPEGASGTRSFEFARRLVARGHQVTILCGTSALGSTGLAGPFVGGRRTGVYEGIEVVEVAVPYSNYDSVAVRAAKFGRFALASVGVALARDYDLIFCTSTPLTVGLPGILAAVLRRKPFVFEIRDLWPEVPRAMGVRNPLAIGAMAVLERLSYRTARRCIGLSPGMVDGIRRLGVPDERVEMIPNGCDLEMFVPAAEPGDRPALDGVGPDDFLAVFMGAHGRINGLEVVVEAARRLATLGRADVKVMLVGDGAMKPALQALARDHGLGGRLLFRDPMPKRRLAHAMRRADCGLMVFADIPPVHFGTSPNKFFDYVALGLPVVNNYPGWLAGMIERERCGLVVPPGDPDALAAAVARLADDRVEARAMGRRSRALAEREFDRRRLADRFVDCLEAAAADGAPRPTRAAGSAAGSHPA
jgi:glycosyltransferase involved in cell wall biosynthesis